MLYTDTSNDCVDYFTILSAADLVTLICHKHMHDYLNRCDSTWIKEKALYKIFALSLVDVNHNGSIKAGATAYALVKATRQQDAEFAEASRKAAVAAIGKTVARGQNPARNIYDRLWTLLQDFCAGDKDSQNYTIVTLLQYMEVSHKLKYTMAEHREKMLAVLILDWHFE